MSKHSQLDRVYKNSLRQLSTFLLRKEQVAWSLGLDTHNQRDKQYKPWHQPHYSSRRSKQQEETWMDRDRHNQQGKSYTALHFPTSTIPERILHSGFHPRVDTCGLSGTKCTVVGHPTNTFLVHTLP
ncbi:hypothetical protein Pcac1_g20813 [Phytophthora cactorum]|nr:hypothetical protein Pcac1_g20813 [Phytophthora cactorum]KAG3039527.1 hypothetical protein PC119_g2111 [Phytophthora cactorum]KAG3102431.1 hypothetical protein PC122_g2257 [Phytophthora cactorum]